MDGYWDQYGGWVDNVGKGKKGAKGTWPSAKGTWFGGAKGGGKGPCYGCGGPHMIANCPKGLGKKGGLKGGPEGGKGGPKGKGVNELGPDAAAGNTSPESGTNPGDQPQVNSQTQVDSGTAQGDVNNVDTGFQGYCFACGGWGHPARFCTQFQGGKSKGCKGGFKGGQYSLDLGSVIQAQKDELPVKQNVQFASVTQHQSPPCECDKVEPVPSSLVA